jgi:Diacylglycerol kinase catalytic domain
MDIDVVVNLNARRGSEQFAAWAQKTLPRSRVVATRTKDDLEQYLASRDGKTPRVMLTGGGDGTVIGVLDAMRSKNLAWPALGILPLGTGNGWANGANAPSPKQAIEAMARAVARGMSNVPTNEFWVVEVEGRVTPFVGAGWDAETLHDYAEQKKSAHPLFRRLVEGRSGYAISLFGRTIPKNLFAARPRVRLINLGASAFALDERGTPYELPDSGPGTVLYDGPYGVAGAGTTTDLGFGMRALPFGRTMPGRMHARIYAASAGRATLQLPQLWRGVHPLHGSHDFLLTHCRMEFDREVPVEVGGDVIGLRKSVDYKVCELTVPLIDWAQLN